MWLISKGKEKPINSHFIFIFLKITLPTCVAAAECAANNDRANCKLCHNLPWLENKTCHMQWLFLALQLWSRGIKLSTSIMTKDGGRLQFYAAIYFHATTCCLSDYWLPPEQDRRKKHMSVNRDPLEIAYLPLDTSLVASRRLFRLTTSRIGCPYYICEDLSLENPCFSSLTSHDFHSEPHQMSSWPSVLSPAWALMGASCSMVFSHNALPGSSCQGRRYFLIQRFSLHYCFKELLTDVLSMGLSEVCFLSQSQNLLYQ